MQRAPIVIFNNVQLTTAVAGATSAPQANAFVTISAVTFNNTTATAQKVSAHIVAAGGTAGAANQYMTEVTVPPKSFIVGSALIGQHIPQGGTLQCLADVGAAISVAASGYVTTL